MNVTASAGTGVQDKPAEHPGRLILARHGQTDHNRSRRLQGQIDIPLNERGRRQAAALGRALAETPPDVILASPLGRAVDTARAVAEPLGMTVHPDHAFLERGFGEWEGLTFSQISQQWPQDHARWRSSREQSLPHLGIEERGDVAHRVADGCRRVLAEHPCKRVLVVAHGAAISLAISELIGLDPVHSRGISGLENCHRSELEPVHDDPTGRAMRLLSHNLPPDFP